MDKSSLIPNGQTWGLSLFPNSILVILFMFPIAYFVVMFGILYLDIRLFWRFLKEDGRLEYLQALSYLLAAFAAAGSGQLAKRLGQKALSVFYFLLALSLVFVSMEEISWGQRIIGFNAPQVIRDLNAQDEFNLHNIDFISNHFLHSAYIITGITSAITWLLIPKRLLSIWRGLMSYIIPGPVTVFYFLPAGLYYSYCELANLDFLPVWFGLESQELVETPLALGFLIFILINFYRLKLAYYRKQ